MTDRCPNCGYCPTCKRANPVYPTVAPQPYNVGYWCHCGVWVAYGSWHQCNVWWPTWTAGNGTTTTGIAGNLTPAPFKAIT